MSKTDNRARQRRWIAGSIPLLAALLALPLMAPTCGNDTSGVKAFSKGSIIIPMDGCYQGDGSVPNLTGCTSPTACTGTTCTGDVIRAYGLVYQLVRNNIAVYWVIKPGKQTLKDVDLTIQFSAPPIGVYNWTTASIGSLPSNYNGTNNTISYKGGPFVIDGSDYAAVVDLFEHGKSETGTAPLKTLFGNTSTQFPNPVKLHVSKLAFTAPVAKTFSGGWNAGGANPPPIALLNLPGGDYRYADHVLEGYLIRAGLAPKCVMPMASCTTANAGSVCGTGNTCDSTTHVCTPCADPSAGTASGTTHGIIYDRLEASDFIPGGGGGGWQSTNLAKNGYKVLWLPHWEGPNSCAGTLGSSFYCAGKMTTGGGGGSSTLCDLAGSDYCSCTQCSPGPKLTGTQVSQVLSTLGSYMTAGNDVFAECASIGTLEGVYNTGGSTVATSFGSGTAGSRYMTTGTGTFPVGGGVYINENAGGGGNGGVMPTPIFNSGYFSSPFTQIGDFPFSAVSGAIQTYRPAAANGSGTYKTGVARIITGNTGSNTIDYFSLDPSSSSGGGNVVYLAGHDYSGFQGNFQIAGTRLVLNTLFNLGATCVPTALPCHTGQLGVCDLGAMDCDANGMPYCKQINFPKTEVCDGLDNDCNGAIDDGLTQTYYPSDQPGCTQNGATWSCVGACQPGVQNCVFPPPGTSMTPGNVASLTPFQPAVTPTAEQCNGIDDDCNGQVDDGIPDSPCFDGAAGCVFDSSSKTWSCKGACQTGTHACDRDHGTWGVCTGEVLPKAFDYCEPMTDDNCNGVLGDGCSCAPGESQPCYTGPTGTLNVGACKAGTRTCSSGGTWGTCTNEVIPNQMAAVCPNTTNADVNCDGIPDPCPECTTGQTHDCYSGTTGCTKNGNTYTCKGVCAAGKEYCVGGKWSGTCQGDILPGPRLCNGKDNDCDGTIDVDNTCGNPDFECVNGTCVTTNCAGPEPTRCDDGFVCSNHHCTVTNCGTAPDSVPCDPGLSCTVDQSTGVGTCADKCAALNCGNGSYCTGGQCVGGGCLSMICPAGTVCLGGTDCVADQCANVTCPAGTFCRAGDCVQACAFVNCPSGQRCDSDGACVADPCPDKHCSDLGKVCIVSTDKSTGALVPSCVENNCANVNCAPKQACVNVQCGDTGTCASCVFDACKAKAMTCPDFKNCPKDSTDCLDLQCSNGQCFGTSNPEGIGGAGGGGGGTVGGGGGAGATSKGGCGCGSGGSGFFAFMLGLIPLVLRRRGTRGSVIALLLVAGVTIGAGCGSSKKEPDGPRYPCVNQCTAVCTSLALDPANCGKCGHACASGEMCADGACGLSSPVAPHIDSATPSSASRGTGATTSIVLTGERFDATATVRVTTDDLTDLAASDLHWVSATELDLSLDLSNLDPTTLQLRVVNPNHVVSNALPFTVMVESPHLGEISPTSGTSGAAIPNGTVTVTGSGFINTSQCRISGVLLPERGLTTTVVSPTQLTCALDVVSLLPDDYTFLVVNQGTLRSNTTTFQVYRTQPAITSLSPASGRPDSSTNTFKVIGTNFDTESKAQLVLTDGSVNVLTTSFVGSTLLDVFDVNLTSINPGTYKVQVVNGDFTSNQVDYTVTSKPPTLTLVSPQTARRDTSVTLTLQGGNFDTSCKVQGMPSVVGANFADLPTSFVNSGQLTATLNLTGVTAASYQVQVKNPDPLVGPSSPLAITIQTDVATLSSLSQPNPPIAPQGDGGNTSITLAATGSNLEATAKLHIREVRANGLTDTALPTTVNLAVSPPTLTATFAHANLNTGTYAISAKNNSYSALSNELFFAITPGTPAITSPLTNTCLVQNASSTTLALQGSNFAVPDASGGGGSILQIAFNLSGGAIDWDKTNPLNLTVINSLPYCPATLSSCISVIDSTHVSVTFDPSTAVLTSYQARLLSPGTNNWSNAIPVTVVAPTPGCP